MSSQISNHDSSYSRLTHARTHARGSRADDQCWICLDGDTAGREVRERPTRTTTEKTTTETREPDGEDDDASRVGAGTEPNGNQRVKQIIHHSAPRGHARRPRFGFGSRLDVWVSIFDRLRLKNHTHTCPVFELFFKKRHRPRGKIKNIPLKTRRFCRVFF